VAETASLLRRENPEKDWQVVARQEGLRSGDLLLLIGSDASLDSSNGAVRLSGFGEMSGISSSAVLETAVVLHASTEVDLDFTSPPASSRSSVSVSRNSYWRDSFQAFSPLAMD